MRGMRDVVEEPTKQQLDAERKAAATYRALKKAVRAARRPREDDLRAAFKARYGVTEWKGKGSLCLCRIRHARCRGYASRNIDNCFSRMTWAAGPNTSSWIDHPSLWVRDRKIVCFVSQPYFDPRQSRELDAVARSGFCVLIDDPALSWYNPDATWVVQVWRSEADAIAGAQTT